MILVCDIGNTFVKSAVFINDKLTSYNLSKDFSSALKLIRSKEINTIVISSVVPAKSNLFLSKLSSFSWIKPVVLNKNLNFNLSIKYSTPDSLGMDRICSAEGALYLVKNSKIPGDFKKGQYLLTIDFGTATTINVVKHPNIFLGGLIAPGIGMMFSSLHDYTAQLPLLTLKSYKSLIGNSTKASIASGVINATVGLIHQTIEELEQIPNNIFITGGNAKVILPHLKYNVNYEKALVLYGVKSIYNKNK